VPFEATVFCETVFLLSGCVNVTLFCTCRQILPPESVVLLKRTISKPKPIETLQPVSDTASAESDPYYAASATIVGYGFSEKYKYKQEPQTLQYDLERGTASNTASVASSASVPYEHTVAPLQIRKTARYPRPPSLILPRPRINSADGDETYDHPEGQSGEDFNGSHRR